MTKGTFGDNLKREREMRGVTLDEISTATRIATRFLQAIENEQWDQLPGGVFNRGFVRAVARYLGLDEESILAEYGFAVNDRPSVPVWTGSPPAVAPHQPWLAWILAGAVIVVLLAGGWFGTRRVLAWRAAKRAAQAAQTTAESAVTAAPTTDPTPAPSSTAPAPGDSNSVPNAAAPGTTAAPVETAPITTAEAPARAPLQLKVEAVKKTKVKIEADGSRVFNETLKAGENHTFEAKDQFHVDVRDAGALLLELNGKTLAPIGAPGHSGQVTLTREALKGAAGGGN